MKKIIIGLILVVIILLGFYIFYPEKEEQIEPAAITPPKPIDLTPTSEEETLVQDWASEDAPIIKDSDRISYIVWHIEWNTNSELYNIWDKKGRHFQISKKDLINSIKQGLPPIVAPAPIPVAIPIPLPTPAPAPTPTPITPPTPTPVTPPAPLPPTPTPTTPVCGNNIIETGEQCEPPGTTTCDANCQTITPPSPSIPAHCGNSIWDGDESDLDCGGSCYKCPLSGQPTYLSCWDNNDCSSGNCDMSLTTPLPAQDPNTGTLYHDYNTLRTLAGQTWIIPWQGKCG